MPAARRTRRSEPVIVEELPERKPFDIPYFAHQQLDPDQFPDNVGLPVGGPLNQANPSGARRPGSGWDDDDEARDEIERGSEDEYQPRTGSQLNKRAAIISLDSETYKRMKVTGGRPAMAKKVSADMDSDDEIIYNMKNAKYLERDIAKRLADEGRMNYNPKTIGTRWARLKKVMQKQQDAMLDADLTDWHEGDDEVLDKACQKAHELVEKAKEAAEARRWRIVADQVKAMKPVTNFSKNACQKRHEAIRNKTAKPTPESIPNPSPAVLARIEARREREQKIIEEQQKVDFRDDNIEGNAWTSRARKYFD